ncbi:MFS transporter [Anaerocolumna sedimenticola]|uniref:MFS transporter n=1 Tax=Anaerocolumna sedimenticola TaxID=2696063 RepID=A0A6P1TSH7_9FIRM|nr:MFS transporter [Anaerocolumna sedimenticola]QHQ63169.1 MFS transporter [Anaerocolumna sedimenticola]
MKKRILQKHTEILMFFILISAVAFANGLSDGVYSNYFKEVYHVTAFQRGFIEFPRELPGLLCAIVIGFIGFLGDLRVAFIAQILALTGVTVLGVFTPAFGIMLIFLFINSLGMHLFMPLQDAIGMSLAEPDKIGVRMGQFSSVRAGFNLIAALLVFFGFRTGFFTFESPVKLMFLIAGVAFLCAAAMSAVMISHVKPPKTAPKKNKLVLRKQYRYYYLLTILHGVQKQIAFVYGTWVIVDLLSKKADTLALLTIVVGFISIFFYNLLGKWMDQFGIKKMMYFDALTFIGVYIIYGFVVWGILSGKLPDHGLAVWFIYLLFISDRLSMQIGMVNSIYLRSIAWNPDEVTSTLSMGISLDHVVSIIAALAGGVIWTRWGSQWVFFMAAAFSLGNLFVAYRVQPDKEKEMAEKMRSISQN